MQEAFARSAQVGGDSAVKGKVDSFSGPTRMRIELGQGKEFGERSEVGLHALMVDPESAGNLGSSGLGERRRQSEDSKRESPIKLQILELMQVALASQVDPVLKKCVAVSFFSRETDSRKTAV